MQAFNTPQASAINATGSSKIAPLANSRQPINVGSANINKITDRTFANPQATLNINRIEPKNIQQNKTNTNNSNIFNLRYFRICLHHTHRNADPFCILRITRLLFQKLDRQDSFL